MSARTQRPTWTCTTCRIAFRHHPTFLVGLAFCCAGCAADGPCLCSYDEEDDLSALRTEDPDARSEEPAARLRSARPILLR